jgi:hypothetical protein
MNYFPKRFRPKWSFVKSIPGADPTVAVYNARAVNFYNTTGSLHSAIKKIFPSTYKKTPYPMYYNTGVVVVNLKVVGLAPNMKLPTWVCR